MYYLYIYISLQYHWFSCNPLKIQVLASLYFLLHTPLRWTGLCEFFFSVFYFYFLNIWKEEIHSTLQLLTRWFSFFFSGRINNQIVINYVLMHELIGGKNQSVIINADKTEKNLHQSSASGCRGRPECLQKTVKCRNKLKPRLCLYGERQRWIFSINFKNSS